MKRLKTETVSVTSIKKEALEVSLHYIDFVKKANTVRKKVVAQL